MEYPLRGGTMFNQVAVFESPSALVGDGDWVHRTRLDAAHSPLKYMAHVAIMAIEDGWVLAEHAGRQLASGVAVAALDWDVALAAYNAAPLRQSDLSSQGKLPRQVAV